MREVIEASPAIKVKDSRLSSQKRDLPPKPRSLIIDSAKSKPYFSARNTTSRLRSKLGVYCGDVEEISQPLFPMGMKTPISILSPCVVSFALHCSNSHATCTERIGIHHFREFPPVSARPARTEPATMGALRHLISLMNPAGLIVAGVSALCALSAGHFPFDQRPISE